MDKLPKYFNLKDYLDLNNDIATYKNINPIDHFINYNFVENRKYNKLINTNYPCILHLDIEQYDYFFDHIIHNKLNKSNNHIKQIFEYHLIQHYSLHNTIISIIINLQFNYIEKGINNELF